MKNPNKYNQYIHQGKIKWSEEIKINEITPSSFTNIYLLLLVSPPISYHNPIPIFYYIDSLENRNLFW